jgi:GNAT superfamily N-acetyltransferase
MQSRLRLSFTRVTDWPAALELLSVRNECRDGMTHNNGIITSKDQYRFYTEHLAPHHGDGLYEAYLLSNEEEAIGYGLLKWDEKNNRYWMTAGLIKKYRGKGLSRFLIGLITEMGAREGNEVWIDVWEDNTALIGDIRVGYEVQDQQLPEGVEGRVLNVMKYNPNRLIRGSEQEILRKFGKKTSTPRDEAKSLSDAMKSIKDEMVEVNQIHLESYE